MHIVSRPLGRACAILSVTSAARMERQKFPVAKIARAVSGAVTSVLSKINAGDATDDAAYDSADDFEQPPPSKRRKQDKSK